MTDNERIYETLGELLYVAAMADGIIQNEELIALKTILKDHPWAEQINWSFNYEISKNSDHESIYQKVINTCHTIGPSPIYQEFISALEKIANAANGIEKSEEKFINLFSTDLIARFQADIEQK